MNTKFIITIILFLQQLSWGMEPKVLVWNLNLLSSNASTASLVANALKNPSLFLQGKSWWTTAKLIANAWSIANKGEEIEKGCYASHQLPTYGTGNVVRKLLTYMNSFCSKGEEFTQEDIYNFCNLAVEPHMSQENMRLARLIKKMVQKGCVSIGICTQDPLEHQLYAKKMADQHYPLTTLFHLVIGIPSVAPKLPENPYPEALKSFVIAPEPYPSPAFFQTIKSEAGKNGPALPIFIIEANPSGVEIRGSGITFVPFTSVEQVQRDLGLPYS